MKIAPAGKQNENSLPFSARGVLYAPKMHRLRPAIPTRSMRTYHPLWGKGGGLRPLDAPAQLARFSLLVVVVVDVDDVALVLVVVHSNTCSSLKTQAQASTLSSHFSLETIVLLPPSPSTSEAKM